MSIEPDPSPSAEARAAAESSSMPALDPAFLALLAWRAVVGGAAFYAAVYKPFETLVMGLVALGLALLLGEAGFRLHRAAQARLQRACWELQARERRAAEARLRYETSLLAQADADERLMQLDRDRAENDRQPSAGGSAATLAMDEFDRELEKEEFESAVAQLRTA